MNRDERQERYAELASVHRALHEEREVAVRAEAENARLRAELSSAIDDARETMGPVERPYEQPWTEGTMSERREHWAAALTEHAFEEYWSLLTEEERETRREFADAVMSVADAEIATLLAQLASDQLRGEVAYDRAVAAEQENACLRRELEAARRAKQETDDRHAATIADLRNALEERYEHRGLDDLANSIYGVLERGSND